VSSELKTIGSNAFKNCTELIQFKFSDSNGLETIKSTAFDGCTALTEKPQISGVATGDEA
ncbi:MAG: leucine-rich repeat domain-containing protein, partial [Clostridia bacterium]|nr:leucine-rich repeat domain-containing protein [Clostridia bacterium]